MENLTANWLCIHKYASPNNVCHCTVRKSKQNYADVCKILSFHSFNEAIELEPAFKDLNLGETSQQFELRLAAEGVQLDFKLVDLEDYYTNRIIKTKIYDLHTGKLLYKYKS